MPTIQINKKFSYAHKGFDVVVYQEGVQSVPQDVYDWAINTGFGQEVDQKKMHNPVKENKALGPVEKPKKRRGRPKGSNTRKRAKPNGEDSATLPA